jgi:hypothetical protein
VGNVANVAYGYAKALVRHGARANVICHDVTHLMSQPEWEDLLLDPEDFPDENNFRRNTAKLGSYQRPDWFVSDTLAQPRAGIHASALLLASRRLPFVVKRAAEPLYYRLLHALDRFNRRGNRTAPADHTSVNEERIRTLKQVAESLGTEWRIDPLALSRHARHGAWVTSHAAQADVVFSYALAPIYALFCPDMPNVSVEIGTMRDVPFGRSAIGRLLWLAYRLSDHVIITNPDSRKLAEAAGVRNYQFCPHPIDETIFHPADEFAFRRELQQRYDAETLLFAPARQNWRLKGNDKMLRGFAHVVSRGSKAVLLIPGWGQEVARSKALSRRLGIAAHVAWLPPMPEPWLARYYRAVDLVLDQFQLGVFGLITPKAMACGAAVLTSYDHGHNSWCFPTPPPLVACSTGRRSRPLSFAYPATKTKGMLSALPPPIGPGNTIRLTSLLNAFMRQCRRLRKVSLNASPFVASEHERSTLFF